MNQKPDDMPEDTGNQTPDYSTNPFDRRRPSATPLGAAGEEDLYEEPDRDTDTSAGFYEHSIEEDDFDDMPDDLLDNLRDETPDNENSVVRPFTARSSVAQEPNPQDWDDTEMTAEEESETWMDDEDYEQEEVVEAGQAWPLGLIAVAAIALILLTAGGYGVMQQRSATQEEIRELRAALANSASPEDVIQSRGAAETLQQDNGQLRDQLYTLSAENRRLADTVAGLEAQLTTQQPARVAGTPSKAPKIAKAQPKSKPIVAAAPIKPRPKTAAAKPQTTPPATAKAAGPWFVNFGSYGQSAAAKDWTKRLKPDTGRVITAPGLKNGTTFYRVRVVDLPNKAAAEKVARTLEREYGLPKLWIGKQD